MQQFHHQVRIAVLFANIEDGGDVRMIQRGNGAGLTQKTLACPCHLQISMQHLDGNVALQSTIPSTVHRSHATRANLFKYDVGPVLSWAETLHLIPFPLWNANRKVSLE